MTPVISGNTSSAAEGVVWSGNETTRPHSHRYSAAASTVRDVTLEIYNFGNDQIGIDLEMI